MASHLICRKAKMREGIIIYFEVDIWSKLQNKFVFSLVMSISNKIVIFLIDLYLELNKNYLHLLKTLCFTIFDA
jgi:hypothetical protein